MRQQPVVVKVDTPGKGAHSIRASYLTKGKGLEGADAVLYGPGAQDAQAFHRTICDDDHRFTLMVSFPEHGGVDRQKFIERYMQQVEVDLGGSLEWLAANHYDRPNPHTHIVIRGVIEGEDFYMKKGYWKHGLRERASELLTKLIGRTREGLQEQTRQEERSWLASLSQDERRHLTSADLFTQEVQRLRRTYDERRLDGQITSPTDPDLYQRQVYGHEGLAAHVDRLWEAVQRQQQAQQEQQMRQWGRGQ
jgi:type IV secretory pathway VirD2 relaxase